MAYGKFGTFLAAGIAALSVAAFATSGQAAPQALALVKTDTPIELACKGEECAAELSAYCLQSDRISPKSGTAYWPTGGSAITVQAITRDGRSLTLAAHDALRFHALRSHTAVRIALAPGLRQRLNLASVRVTLAENVTLAPEAEPGDDNPITAGELALLENSLRPAGTAIVERNGDAMVAARVTNRMINILPVHEVDRAASGRAWRQLMAQARQGGLSPMASRLAQNAFELCRFFADQHSSRALRKCLQGQHDSLMQRLNSDYWKAVKTGS